MAQLYKFQELDAGYIHAVLLKHGGGYIGHERGLGKTISSCALIDELDSQRTLVVAPNTAKSSVWEPEMQELLPWLDIFVLPNTKAKREACLADVKHRMAGARGFVLIVHYEQLAIIGGPEGRGWKKYGEWDLVVADEAHRIRNPKAKMTRALKKVPTRYKLALSGSVIMNHAEELYSPLNWLFPDSYRSKWRDWNDRFLDYVDNGYAKVCVGVKAERLEELREELGVMMVYRRKEDELDLPPKTEQTLYVDLSPKQKAAYDELLATCRTRLDDGTDIKATDGLVMLGRLRQVATGLDLLGTEVTDSSKLYLACDLIEDAEDEAFVVFSWFKLAGRSLAARLEAKGIQCHVVDGDVPHDVRASSIASFQAGEGRVFIGTISTLGESVTLTRASNALFLDVSWNPGSNAQAEDRIHRIGQTKPTTITRIVARDTVDELRVTPTLASKEAIRAAILGGTR